MTSLRLLFAAPLALLACSSAQPAQLSTDAGPSGQTDAADGSVAPIADGGDASVTPITGAACNIGATSSLPGVTLRFTGTVCTFTLAQAAAGISIPYELVVDHDIAGTYPHRQYSGDCSSPSHQGVYPLESLTGNGQIYALVDLGLPCADAGANSEPPVTITKGTYSATFQWQGKNYSGPSDTNTRPGAPFPIGNYTLTVDAMGTVDADGGPRTPYDVNASFHVVLVP